MWLLYRSETIPNPWWLGHLFKLPEINKILYFFATLKW